MRRESIDAFRGECIRGREPKKGQVRSKCQGVVRISVGGKR